MEYKSRPQPEQPDNLEDYDVEVKVEGQESEIPNTEDQTTLLGMMMDYYKEGQEFLEPKRQEWLRRLKLYNNQKKNPKDIGNSMMYTMMTTVVAGLYEDKLAVIWEAEEEGDVEQADNLNKLAEYDYKRMGRNVSDYYWIWNTAFYGASFKRFIGWDNEFNTPIEEIMDNWSFIHDPRADSINGHQSPRNACRYFGEEIELTKDELRAQGDIYFNVDKIGNPKEFASTPWDSLRKQGQQAAADAQNLGHPVNEQQHNKNIPILRLYLFFKGKRCLVEATRDCKTLIRYHVLEEQRFWEVVDRKFSPDGVSFWGTSIPDSTEDKQRQTSIIENLIVKGAKTEVFPNWLIRQGKVKPSQVKFGFNRAIQLMGSEPFDQLIAPLRKNPMAMANLVYILQMLTQNAEKANATPEIKQGVLDSQSRTLGEVNLAAANVDTRYGLTAAIFGWSEAAYWYLWYNMYKRNTDVLTEKTIRIKGVYGYSFRKLTRENIITTVDPDITITSRKILKQENEVKLVKYLKFYEGLLNDPESNRREALKELGRLSGLEEEDIKRFLPDTIDEMIAEKQNEKLNENTLVPILPQDNHSVHIEVHRRANDTPATRAHIEAHKVAKMAQKQNPDLFPNTTPGLEQATPTNPAIGAPGNLPVGGQRRYTDTAPQSFEGAGIQLQ